MPALVAANLLTARTYALRPVPRPLTPGSRAVSDLSAVVVPENSSGTKRKRKDELRRKRQPRYHVILWDSEDHSYEYVIRMMQELFRHDEVKGFVIAKAVDTSGRATCMTTTKEHAELKRDQIHAYGKDHGIPRCKGSMFATIEPESD